MRLFFLILLIFSYSTASYADSSYKPNDASCLKQEGKTCSEIDLSSFKSCVFDYPKNFVFDDQKRLVAIKGPKIKIVKKSNFIVREESFIGCNHHTDSKTYNFNYNFSKKDSRENFNCKKAVEVWSKIRKEIYNVDEKCVLRNPQNNAFETSCGIISAWELKDTDVRCDQAYKMANGGIMLGKSKVKGYEFSIEETGYDN